MTVFFYRRRLTESESTIAMLYRSLPGGTTAALMLRTTPSRMSPGGLPVSNASMSVTTSVLDFNASPELHIQEVLGIAKQDLKRLRAKYEKTREKERLFMTAVFNRFSVF
jgi:hypothetical protein